MSKILYILTLPLMLLATDLEKSNLESGSDPIVEVTGLDQENKKLRLSIISNDGAYISLTDGRIYNVREDDREKSSAWLGNASEVDVEDLKDDSEFPLKITNKSTGSSVQAKLSSIAEADSEVTKPENAGPGIIK